MFTKLVFQRLEIKCNNLIKDKEWTVFSKSSCKKAKQIAYYVFFREWKHFLTLFKIVIDYINMIKRSCENIRMLAKWVFCLNKLSMKWVFEKHTCWWHDLSTKWAVDEVICGQNVLIDKVAFRQNVPVGEVICRQNKLLAERTCWRNVPVNKMNQTSSYYSYIFCVLNLKIKSLVIF